VTRFISRLLRPDDDLMGFSSGVESLDNWLHSQAQRAHKAGICAVTVWVESETSRFCGYYAIAPTHAQRIPDSLSRSLSGGFSTVPAYRIARLAVASQLQRKGIGKQLLLDAVKTVIHASENAGGRLIIIDLVNEEVAKWYDRLGFAASADGSQAPAPRYMTIADAKQSISGS